MFNSQSFLIVLDFGKRRNSNEDLEAFLNIKLSTGKSFREFEF